jgi:C4-dicarboxylate transporter, DctM subunit
VATVATMGVTALPQQEKRGYNEKLFLGSLAAGGSLGILIPPSMNMIVFGALTNTSVPQLFLAGIIPGIMLAIFYMMVILTACLIRPKWGGQPEPTSWQLRVRTLPDLLPPIGILIIVLGSIYAGFATPTEAAALGVVAALALSAWKKRLSGQMLADVFKGTIRTAAMITLILIFAFFLNFTIAAIGLVQQVNDFIVGLGWTPIQTMLLIICIYIVMGMFIEALPMVVLTVTVLAPVVEAMGFSLVWFGIIVVLVSETAMLTPPIGMICYVIQGVRQKGSLNDVFLGVAPFFVAVATMIGLLLAFPQIALWLPQNAFQ